MDNKDCKLKLQKRITVCAKSAENREKAEKLAEKLGAGMRLEMPEESDEELALCYDTDGLYLYGKGLSLHGDFQRMLPRLRNGFLQRELLVRAAKIKREQDVLTAIDATAGLGEDAILLAAAGYNVTLYEYNPIIAALLEDAMDRARKNGELESIVARMKLLEEDSVAAMPLLKEKPDIVLLDPMFPARQKSALVKKKFQLLQQLEQPCDEESSEALFRSAAAADPRKVIIKRPHNGPCLAGVKPSYSIEGKGIRYDCVVLRG